MHQDRRVDLQRGEHVVEHRHDHDAAADAEQSRDNARDHAGGQKRDRQQAKRNEAEIFQLYVLSRADEPEHRHATRCF